MSPKINFDEPIPHVVDRLKAEHQDLYPKLAGIETACDSNVEEAVRMLEGLSQSILHHAVEEEAIIMRVIMREAKAESGDSVRVMQEHRWVSEFLERRLGKLHSVPHAQAQTEIRKFIKDLREHFSEEEGVVFPLALRANSSPKQV